MTDNFGTGVSRVMDPKKTQMTQVVWQQNKPPLDSELNLLQQIATNWDQSLTLKGVPSGWIGNGVNDHEAFITNPAWSNWFRYGQQKTGELGSIQWAVVNGWIVPVTGTKTGTPPGSPNDADTWNKINLSPPPSNSGDSRIDFVFLEVWKALIPSNPSTTNKPSASGVWPYGNVEGGFSFLSDDLIDPALGFETTQRVQIQYRIRVVTGLVGLTSYPDGFDPASVKGRGGATTDTAFTFTNMRQTLGDAGLWRAGDGTANSLGTVDGYSYAIPLSVVFRRNTVAWDGDPGQNLNGGVNRNPTAIDRTGATTFATVPNLASNMDSTQLTLSLSTAAGIALPASGTGIIIRVGEEYMTYSVRTATTLTLTARGFLGTKAEAHKAGVAVTIEPGRPDGLFADQVAKTDILDVRHVVNPNGFNYDALLKGNLDALLKGELRANWKRSGGGPQGAFVAYQDKVSASAAALGVTKLDAPDNIRQIWSDASCLQPIEFIAKPPVGTSASEDITTTWGLQLSATVDNTSGLANNWTVNKAITIPVAQFKSTVPGADADQVSFPLLSNTVYSHVKIRIAGTATDLIPGTGFTVAVPTGPSDNLVITLLAGAVVSPTLAFFITFHVQYGAGRGMSRRPDSMHSVSYLNAATGTLLRQRNTAANNTPMGVAWAALWSKFKLPANMSTYGQIPVTAESYVDPGSKTVVLTPFRKVGLPTTSVPFRAVRSTTLHSSQGLMPNPGSKWGAATDPLGLFSTNAHAGAAGSTYVVIPRNLMPSWGAVHVPIIHTDTSDFAEGLNFAFYAAKGAVASVVNPVKAVVPYSFAGSRSFATFSTAQYSGGIPSGAAPFNVVLGTPTAGAPSPVGARFFTDARGLGRSGIELPPFMGISRLFAVYEATNYATVGSAYNADTRAAASGATNLLRQDFEGPTMWIEIDSDGDSTFILNADAIDISKSPNVIANFTAGHYVIEASIFGFDRGAFDLSSDCRIVLTRSRTIALDAAGSDAALSTNGLSLVIPAPPQGADSIAVNYSRTPYQGDAFGSQNNQQDISQLIGPLTSGIAFQISSTELSETTLTKPNPKQLEVLAAVHFQTTLGSGRIAGGFQDNQKLDFRFPGYEQASVFPPTSGVAARPVLQAGPTGPVLIPGDDLLALGTEYHGCTERLPLGSFFRDKDFRGNALDGITPFGFAYREPVLGIASNISKSSVLEQRSVPVTTASVAQGGPGDIVVHVDGENGNYALLTNYRTTRGGSSYVVSGPQPGGEVGAAYGRKASGQAFNAVLNATAFLVRNSVTNVGITEVSAGGELMMLITTTATRQHTLALTPEFVLCGTQGSGEGFSASDLYRIGGRPLVTDGVRVVSTDAVLGKKVSFKPRIGG